MATRKQARKHRKQSRKNMFGGFFAELVKNAGVAAVAAANLPATAVAPPKVGGRRKASRKNRKASRKGRKASRKARKASRKNRKH